MISPEVGKPEPNHYPDAEADPLRGTPNRQCGVESSALEIVPRLDSPERPKGSPLPQEV